MKRFALIYILLFCVAGNYAFADNKHLESLYDIFPNMAELKGGDSKWIATGVVDELFDDYVILSSTYNYFSSKNEKIWDIKRKKNYSVDVSLYFAKDTEAAKRIYSETTDAKKSRYERDIDFGEEGRIFIRPVSVVNMISEYNLYYRMQNFIVHLHTFDGFALMDFADFFRIKINNFILKNIDMYVFKNFTIDVSKQGYLDQRKELTVSTDNTSTINIAGSVVDSSGEPVSDAMVNIPGHDKYTSTDESGNYSLTFNLGQGTEAKYSKNFILYRKNIAADNASHVSAFNVDVKYPQRTENLFLKINSREKTGQIFLTDNDNYNSVTDMQIDGNYISFKRNCTPEDSFFNCSQQYEGIIKNDSIKGNWKGTGGKGTFSGESLSAEKSVFNPAASDKCSFKFFELSDNQTMEAASSGSYKIGTDRVAALKCNNFKDSFFHKDAALTFKIQPNNSLFKLYLKTAEINNDKRNILNEKYLGTLGDNDKTEAFHIPLKIENLGKMHIITAEAVNGKNSKLILSDKQAPAQLTIYKFINEKDESQKPEIIVKLVTLESERDLAGKTENLGNNGKKDMQLKLITENLSGSLKSLKITQEGENSFTWNTEPFDIYPAIALVTDGTLINRNADSLNLSLDKYSEIDIFMHKYEYININNIDLVYKMLIDNEWYTGNVITTSE